MDQATVPPPHDTLRALGCPKSRPTTAQTRVESRMRSRLSGSPARRIAQVGSQKRNRSSRAWSGDQTKHGNRKYDIEIRYCHFVSRTYSQMYDGRARARTADTHAHRTTRTKLNCRTKHEHSCGNCAQNRHTHQMQRAILRMGLSLSPRGSKSRPNAKCRQAEDRSRICRLDACERGKWG